MQIGSDVVSSEAPANEIDYKIELVKVEKKKKHSHDAPAWVQSMYERNPPRSARAPNFNNARPVEPSMLQPPPVSFIYFRIQKLLLCSF
jgi:hypothetical protein